MDGIGGIWGYVRAYRPDGTFLAARWSVRPNRRPAAKRAAALQFVIFSGFP